MQRAEFSSYAIAPAPSKCVAEMFCRLQLVFGAGGQDPSAESAVMNRPFRPRTTDEYEVAVKAPTRLFVK